MCSGFSKCQQWLLPITALWMPIVGLLLSFQWVRRRGDGLQAVCWPFYFLHNGFTLPEKITPAYGELCWEKYKTQMCVNPWDSLSQKRWLFKESGQTLEMEWVQSHFLLLPATPEEELDGCSVLRLYLWGAVCSAVISNLMSHWNQTAAVKRLTTREIRISLSHLEGAKLLESWVEDALPLKSKELRNKASPGSCQNLTVFCGRTPVKGNLDICAYMFWYLSPTKVNSITVRI